MDKELNDFEAEVQGLMQCCYDLSLDFEKKEDIHYFAERMAETLAKYLLKLRP